MADSDAERAPKKARTEIEDGAAPSAPPAPAADDGGAPSCAARTVLLGGVRVCAIGLGTLPAGVAYPAPSERPNSATFRAIVAAAAAAAAPTPLLVDCADTYCEPYKDMGALERQLGAIAAAMAPGALVLGTKSGMQRNSSESNGWRPNPAAQTPAGVRKAILAARAALCPPSAAGGAPPPLFLWSLHHADGLAAPGTLEACLAAAAECVAAGELLHVGLCNASVPLLERALAVLGPAGVACVQNEWSPYQREAEKARPPGAAASSKKGVLRFCAARCIPFVAYAPLGGLKARRAERVLARDHPAIAALAAKRGVSAHAACLAALLHRGAALGAQVVLIPGARTAAHAADSVAAAALRLSEEELNAALPPVA